MTASHVQADAKALFKAIQALHRGGWQIEEPAVKAHVALKAKVLVQDVCGALEDAASLHLQHSGWTLVQRGHLVQSSVFHCPEEELDVLQVTLRCTEDSAGGALFNVAVQTFKSRKFAIDRCGRISKICLTSVRAYWLCTSEHKHSLQWWRSL